MSKRTVFAAAFSQPMAYVAQQGGARMLANLAKENIPFLHVGITTTRKFMRERRSQAKAYLRAYGRAVHFMHTRKEETKAIFAKYTKIKDPGMLDGSVRLRLRLHRESSPGESRRIPGDARRHRQEESQGQTAKPEQFFDNSLVQELIDEGFFVKLWGKNPQ